MCILIINKIKDRNSPPNAHVCSLPFPVQFHSLQAESIALLVLHVSSSFNHYLIYVFCYFMCMDVCISVYHMCAWCPPRPKEGVSSLETAVSDGGELLSGAALTL